MQVAAFYLKVSFCFKESLFEDDNRCGFDEDIYSNSHLSSTTLYQ